MRPRGFRRRDFLVLLAAPTELSAREVPRPPRPIIVSVRFLPDRGAHSGKVLSESELQVFARHQEKARREYANSGIHFDVRVIEGAFLRTQGYSEIPEKFLDRRAINLFVTETLAYDIDRDRSGGCSSGPRPRTSQSPPDPFFKTFLGLREARENTLAHEYAHHFCLDTLHSPTSFGNVRADLRNDYWLWRQRHGAFIQGFRACVNAPWARLE